LEPLAFKAREDSVNLGWSSFGDTIMPFTEEGVMAGDM